MGITRSWSSYVIYCDTLRPRLDPSVSATMYGETHNENIFSYTTPDSSPIHYIAPILYYPSELANLSILRFNRTLLRCFLQWTILYNGPNLYTQTVFVYYVYREQYIFLPLHFIDLSEL